MKQTFLCGLFICLIVHWIASAQEKAPAGQLDGMPKNISLGFTHECFFNFIQEKSLDPRMFSHSCLFKKG